MAGGAEMGKEEWEGERGCGMGAVVGWKEL